MLRLFLSLCAAAALGLLVPASWAQEGKEGKHVKAKIVVLKPETAKITVRMVGEDGKEVERTFELKREVRYVDSAGRAAKVDIFRSGDQVLVVAEKGALQELRQQPTAKGDDK